ncbi:A-kinase anchor protein 17A isoform X2 [Amyelois transitella]|uniref:A-kinase anchor protein 17A isoform X2 n=1 Tax=Amyelois transitella TaxID=680683 RepID=UPI00067C7EF3|nr:A-kinase anchor protein 17A isoform X2 [Amyelois transitella]
MNIQICRDTSDAVALYLPQRLYLKPFAKLNISIQLPPHKVHNKSISNWELMEKLRKMIQPDGFSVLKVSKHSSEVIRFDAELDNVNKLQRVMSRLDDRVIQLNNFPEPLKVKVSEAKSDFPSRHAWDSFFRDATDMDEMKPGERPDTVHIENLPIRWFVHHRDQDDDAPPSESILKKVFEKFGAIRQVDIPCADPFRMQMKVHMRGISTPAQNADLYFDAYVQFSEYVGFVRCMDALRGRKLLRKRDDIAEWCGIAVDFDKTKHMTDAAVKRRAIVRERLAARQRTKDDEERMEKEKLAKKQAKERQKAERQEIEKLQKMKEREERRKKKQLAKLIQKDNLNVNVKVLEEQRKLLKAQKRLQAIRLMEELFKRIELRPELQNHNSSHRQTLKRSERSRVVDHFKRLQEKVVEEMRQQLKDALDGRVVIRSALETKKPVRASSASSFSSEDEKVKRIKTERLTTPEREFEYSKATGMYGVPPGYGFGFPFGVAPGYPFPQSNPMYYPVRGAYYPPPDAYRPRFRARGRGRGRGLGARMPYFDGPDASHQYYMYFKKLTEQENRNEHDDRARSRSRRRSYSRSRSRRRSYSRSKSREREYSRSRSRERRRRSRSRSRRSRSRSRRSRSHRSRSRNRSRSRSRRSRTKSRSRSKHKSPSPRNKPTNGVEETPQLRQRSKSWSLPKEGERDQRKSWSKSPKEK